MRQSPSGGEKQPSSRHPSGGPGRVGRRWGVTDRGGCRVSGSGSTTKSDVQREVMLQRQGVTLSPRGGEHSRL